MLLQFLAPFQPDRILKLPHVAPIYGRELWSTASPWNAVVRRGGGHGPLGGFFSHCRYPYVRQEGWKTIKMSEPLVITIPHRLGKDEALHRIKTGLSRAKTEFAWLLSLEEEIWTGDRLTFRAAAMGQRAQGTMDVYENGVRLEVRLPWLLARFAHAVHRVIGQKGQLLLEKK